MGSAFQYSWPGYSGVASPLRGYLGEGVENASYSKLK